MPPIWMLVERLEGRVSPTACLFLLLTLGVASIVAGVYGHPLPALGVLLLVESLCCAASRAYSRVYRLPRLVERLGDLSRLGEYLLFTGFYARRGGPGSFAILAISMMLVYAASSDAKSRGEMSIDYMVTALYASSAAMLEAYTLTGLRSLLDAALIPVLGAAGVSAATLIYREATGV